MQPLEPHNDPTPREDNPIVPNHPSGLPIVPPPQSPPDDPDTHPILGAAPVPKLQPFIQRDEAQSDMAAPADAPVRPHPDEQAPGAAARPVVFGPAAAPGAFVGSSPSANPQTSPAPVVGGQTWFQPSAGYETPPGAGSYPQSPFSPQVARSRGSRFRKLALLIGIPLLVLLMATGYVFGIYIPNKPANVFKSGLSRTGMAVDKLTQSTTDNMKLDTYKKGMSLSGSVVVDDPQGTRHSGTFSSKSDSHQTDSQLHYSPDNTKNDFSAQLLSDLADGSKYPNIYFRLSGFSAFGAAQLPPEIAQYDGKWISIGSDYLKSLIPPDMAKQADKSEFTNDDAVQLVKTAESTASQYVFTNDPSKSLLVNKTFKGKEKLDGQTAYRYEVSIDKDHAKDFCKALITNVMGTDAYKHIPGVSTDTLSTDKQSAIESCQKSAASIKDSDTFDMWVSQKTKLIAKVRFTDQTHKSDYMEIGQSYTGGHILPTYVYGNFPSEHYNAKFSLSVDMDKNITQGSVVVNTNEKDNTWHVVATLTFQPNTSDVKVTKPAGAIPIQQVFQSFGIDPAAMTAAIQGEAADTERQTDLHALQSQLEAYYAKYGMYPTLDEVNLPSWRKVYMSGLDDAALQDPSGTAPTLAANATATQYGYTAGACADPSVRGCQSYTLSAIESDGLPLTLTNLASPASVAPISVN